MAIIRYAGTYSLLFFDGVSKAVLPASVKVGRTVATIPPVDNPPIPPHYHGHDTGGTSTEL